MRWRKRLGALFLAVVLLLADSGNINFAMASEAENLNAEILQESTEEIDTETAAESPEELGKGVVTESASQLAQETDLSIEDTDESKLLIESAEDESMDTAASGASGSYENINETV